MWRGGEGRVDSGMRMREGADGGGGTGRRECLHWDWACVLESEH